MLLLLKIIGTCIVLIKMYYSLLNLLLHIDKGGALGPDLILLLHVEKGGNLGLSGDNVMVF